MRTETESSTPRAGDLSREPALLRCLPGPGIRIPRRPFLALLVVGWALVVPREANADVIYNVVDYPTLQNGYTVTGTITTDGKIGVLGNGDFTNWDVTISRNGVTVDTFSSQGGIGSSGSVTASATSITVQSDALLDFVVLQNGHATEIFWPGPTVLGTYSVVDFSSGASLWSSTLPAPYTVATAAAAVPEPSIAALTALAACTFLAYGWSRHRRDQRRQGAA